MLVLRTDDVVGAIGFQVGGEFFVENLGALVGSQDCWVAGEYPRVQRQDPRVKRLEFR